MSSKAEVKFSPQLHFSCDYSVIITNGLGS